MGKSANRVHKPFDRVVKDLAEEAPRLLLDLVGLVPADSAVTVTPLRPETAPPMALPDYVAEMLLPSGERFMAHVEFLVCYRHSYPRTMARYGGSIAWQYQVSVESVLLLLRRDGAPAEVPPVGEIVIGKTIIRHPFRTVRLWELDPAPVIRTRDPRLFPWAVLMRSTDEQVRALASAMARRGDELTMARFLTLGSIRYDREQLEEMAGGKHMGLVEAIMEGSSLVREAKEIAAAQGREEGLAAGRAEGLAEGRNEGRNEGRTEGQVHEARRVLRRALQTRFPGLEDLPAIDRIQSAEVLEALLFDHALTSDSRGQVESAVLAAAKVPYTIAP